MQETRCGRVDFAEICCSSDSLLSGAVTSLGGCAVLYSHWIGFDLTTKARTDKLKEDLFEKRPRVVWMTPPCATQRTHQSQSRSKFHRKQENMLVVFLWLVEQEWCETILEQMWGWTSLGCGGAFSDLKEQFRSGRTPGCQWVNSLMERFLQNAGTTLVRFLLCSRRRLRDRPHQTLEKETLQYTPQLVKTVAKEIMKVESSKQIFFTGMLFNDD